MKSRKQAIAIGLSEARKNGKKVPRKKSSRAVAGFPLDRSAPHIAIDMQRLFAERTEWFMPWLDRVLPNVVAIASHAPERTVCTRFIPPRCRSR